MPPTKSVHALATALSTGLMISPIACFEISLAPLLHLISKGLGKGDHPLLYWISKEVVKGGHNVTSFLANSAAFAMSFALVISFVASVLPCWLLDTQMSLFQNGSAGSMLVHNKRKRGRDNKKSGAKIATC